MNEIFMTFDKVTYRGEKFRGELKGKIGMITARVDRSDTTYVVDYGSDAYVMDAANLQHWKAPNIDEQVKIEQEIYRRRKPKSEDD